MLIWMRGFSFADPGQIRGRERGIMGGVTRFLGVEGLGVVSLFAMSAMIILIARLVTEKEVSLTEIMPAIGCTWVIGFSVVGYFLKPITIRSAFTLGVMVGFTTVVLVAIIWEIIDNNPKLDVAQDLPAILKLLVLAGVAGGIHNYAKYTGLALAEIQVKDLGIILVATSCSQIPVYFYFLAIGKIAWNPPKMAFGALIMAMLVVFIFWPDKQAISAPTAEKGQTTAQAEISPAD
jgi:hypothetical protein